MRSGRCGWPRWRSRRGNFFAALSDAEALSDDWWRELLGRDNTALFGAFDGDTLAGITGVFADRDDPTGQTAALGMTWLDPAYRGRGVGHRFYVERLAWARTRGLVRVAVSHRASNEPSRRAILAAGFLETGRRSHRWPDGRIEDDVCYERDLVGRAAECRAPVSEYPMPVG